MDAQAARAAHSRNAPLDALMALGGAGAELIEHRMRAWHAEPGFADLEHEITVGFSGAAISDGKALVAAIGAHRFSIAGMIVVDCALLRCRYCPHPPGQMLIVLRMLVMEAGWLESGA